MELKASISKNGNIRFKLAFILTPILIISSTFSAIASNSNNAQAPATSNAAAAQANMNNNGRSELAPGHNESATRGKSDLDHGNNDGKGQGKNNQGNDGNDKAANPNRSVAVNIVLTLPVTNTALQKLSKFGRITSVIEKINAVTMRTSYGEISALRELGIVRSLNEDAARSAIPVRVYSEISSATVSTGFGSWNLDMIDVTEGVEGATTRKVSQTGAGTYVAVLDTGLLRSWRNYFDSDNIAEEYGVAFGGGGGEQGSISTQPNKWQQDQDSHGTHVTSTIIGYKYTNNRRIEGVAPDAKVIPVKVLGQNGSGWSSVIAAGIVYVADLKEGPLSGSPVVINMSLGGSVLDDVEKAAIDYAISKGVIIVASAGNSGFRGMGFPGAYAPVISVAASGWTGEWTPVTFPGSWWRSLDVPETGSESAYITDFSSRQLSGQQLDVSAPGSWIIGPYQTNGQLSWYYLGGTSMASPHVAGVVALMMQKNKNMLQSLVESKLKSSAWPIIHRAAAVRSYAGFPLMPISWGDNAVGSGLVNAAAALSAVTAAP